MLKLRHCDMPESFQLIDRLDGEVLWLHKSSYGYRVSKHQLRYVPAMVEITHIELGK